MAGVGLVLDQHLPVAVVHVAQHAARDLQPPGGGAVHHVVDAGQGLAEVLFKAEAGGGHPAEHEATVVVDMAHGHQPLGGLALRERGVLVAGGQRQGGGAAVGAEAPGVVGAAEELAGVAAGFGGDAGTFVRAAIVQHMHRAVVVPRHQHRLRADRGGEVVAGVRHLGVVADIDPGVGEQALHLQREDVGISVDVAVDLGIAHQGAQGGGIVAVAHAAVLSSRKESTVFNVSSSACPASSFNAASRRRRTHSAASGWWRRRSAAAMTRAYLPRPRAWVSL